METIIRFFNFYSTFQIIETSKDIKIPNKGDGYVFDGGRHEVIDIFYEYSDENVVTIHIKVA
jgi:hypothetical protein